MSRVSTSKGSKRAVVLALGAAVAAVMAMGLFSRVTSANDIAHYQTFFDTDVASAGFGGMRGDGTGTLTLTGVSGTVNTALLFWHGPTDSTSSSVNASVTFDGHDITGTNIGFSSDNNWDFDNSQAYRADVTSYVSGNGVYTLADFIKETADVNGASLIVFFDDGNDTNNRDVVLFDGNDSNNTNPYDAAGWDVTLAGITYTSGSASIELHVSDGQTWLDDPLILNGTTLDGADEIFQGDSVPNGPSAETTDGGLWDIKSYDVTGWLSPGANTLELTSALSGIRENGDCLSLIVAAVNLPAGAAPTIERTAVPTVHHRKTATPAPKPTDTPAPPTATSMPPVSTLPPATATPSGGVGPAISPPATGDGPTDGRSPAVPGLAAGALAAFALAGGLYLRTRRQRR